MMVVLLRPTMIGSEALLARLALLLHSSYYGGKELCVQRRICCYLCLQRHLKN